jgi:hypothetical protein
MASRLEWHDDRVMALLNAAGARGVSRGADMIAETSQDRVPVQTGELKRSQQTVAEGLQAVVGYTDSKAVGAHENLAVNLRNGKEAKFLEKAANERREDIVRAIAEELRRVL